MLTEAEKRLHQCCFTGHRPEKLKAPENQVRQGLEAQIDRAVADGYDTFITGCTMGVDIWAGEIVLRKRQGNPALRLIAASPWPGFAARWSGEWQSRYNRLLLHADLVVYVCSHYHPGVFQMRNEWMVDRSSRVIANYDGTAGGTRNTIAYAERKGVECCVLNQGLSDKKEP